MTQESYSWAFIKQKTIIQKDKCISLFNEALFSISKTWRQSACPLIDKRKNSRMFMQWNITLIKRNDFESVKLRLMNPEAVTQSEVSQKEKILFIYTYVWNVGKWYCWTYLQGKNRNTTIREQTSGHSRGRREWDGLRE